jgi:glycosyltransferase involved in cell wall biosynthesis
VTVVVPTFNRGHALRATLTALLASATEGLKRVEIIVIDDGSNVPAAALVNSLTTVAPFSLRCIRQRNSGPGPARNTGFRQARGRIVIFVDDDIIAPSTLIRRHVLAHAEHLNSVICGVSVLLPPASPTPLFRFIAGLSGHSGNAGLGGDFAPIDVPASGHISIERDMFEPNAAFYSDHLLTPAAEEFELAYRLKGRGIAILLALRIIARHDQALDLESICKQQYKHALGTAEVIKKYPAARNLHALEKIIRSNLETPPGFTLTALKRAVMRGLACAAVRTSLLRTVQGIQYMMPTGRLDLQLFYRAVVSAHYHAGLRDGMRRGWR